ncbi:hypothetical protein Goshw_015455, partial [Gossypium schwendimanii]|nr:hypothetical protein [Gossypium schwendimanii]
ELGFQDICVEGDSLTVVKKLNDEHNDRSEIADIIKELKSRYSRFRNISFRHTFRSANGAAHGIAFYGQQYDSPIYWVEEVPLDIEHLILKDMQGFREG